MSLVQYIQSGLRIFMRNSLISVPLGTIVYYRDDHSQFYARAISLRHLIVMSGIVSNRSEKNYNKGRSICVYDSDGRYHLIEADAVNKVEDPSKVIEDLQSARDKALGSERVKIVRTIEFLEDSLRMQPKH